MMYYSDHSLTLLFIGKNKNFHYILKVSDDFITFYIH